MFPTLSYNHLDSNLDSNLDGYPHIDRYRHTACHCNRHLYEHGDPDIFSNPDIYVCADGDANPASNTASATNNDHTGFDPSHRG